MGWKVKGDGKDVLEVWEDFYGDLWFVTDKEDDVEFGYVRLYNMPEFAEWGSFSIACLKKDIGEHKIWMVDKKNWCNINTYEDGLLVEVE